MNRLSLLNKALDSFNGGKQINSKELKVLYSELSLQERASTTKKTSKISIRRPQESNYVLDGVSKIYNNCPYFDLIILGSYADNSFTLESDIDDFVIIRKETFQSYEIYLFVVKKLDTLSRYFQFVDPLQHHGHWLFFESELEFYNESIMPLVVFEGSVSIGRDINLLIHVDHSASSIGQKEILKIQLRTVEKYSEELFKKGLRAFYLKELISSIALIIPLLYQVKGIDLSKRNALNSADVILDERSLRVIEWTTVLRNNWHTLRFIQTYYHLFRMLKGIKFTRNQLEFISRSISPKYHVNEALALVNLSHDDFKYFNNFVKTLLSEAR